MLTVISVVALAAIMFFSWKYYRKFAAADIDRRVERRRERSRLVSRGSFVDGTRHVDVALALQDSMFYYENADTEGSIDLHWVREIEYAKELATGGRIDGGKVLRLRSQSQVFVFVLPDVVVARWLTMLPQRTATASAV